jgi:uncharacterized protein with von Willebrand factor type A (vWA) domain
MIPAVARFVEGLRRAGVAASPAEVLDATRAIDRIGVEDRQRFRTALKATLVKTHEHVAVFDRLFDEFFATPARARRRRRRDKPGGGHGVSRRAAPEGAPRSVPDSPRRPHRREPRTDDRPRAPHESVRKALRAATPGKPGRTGRLRRAVLDDLEPSDRRGPAGPISPLHRDLTRPMATEQERALAAIVPRLLDTIRLRISRRARRARRGRVWTRRIFRENLSREGVPFVLPRRRPKTRRSRIVLLVDVSFSAARSTGYFLWMASSFLQLGRHARVLAFVDRPVEITRELGAWIRGRAPTAEAKGGRRHPGRGIRPSRSGFDELLFSIPGLNLLAPSDYGRTFDSLRRSRLRPAGRDTVLVVLGDARTNRLDPLPWALEEIARRCRYVLWLVPEARERWGTGDSELAGYLPFVDTVVEARDLSGIARGLEELLRRW